MIIAGARSTSIYGSLTAGSFVISLTLEIRIQTYDFDRLCESENDFWSVLVYAIYQLY